MAREDRQRRPSGGRTTRNALDRRRVWRSWHHGKDEARWWLAAVARLDAEGAQQGDTLDVGLRRPLPSSRRRSA